MVEKLAMSEELGLQHFSGKGQISDATQLKIDLEVDKILNESYKRAMDILRTHRIELNNLAEALVQNEQWEVNSFFDREKIDAELIAIIKNSN